MKCLKLVALAALVAPLFSESATAAGCARGNNALIGSLGARENETRSYTINGTALLAVAGAKDQRGDAAGLDVSIPGCIARTAPTVACTVKASDREVEATIRNPHRERVTYYWVCAGLD